MGKLLITGATGHLGKAVALKLLNTTSADDISVLTRSVSKASDLKAKGINLIKGDYNDYHSLVNAFHGIEKLYFVSGSDVVNRTRQHENVVKAAAVAKVKHIIYTSFLRKTEDETSPIALVASSHIQTEKWIKESELAYTILRHTLYADMLPLFIGDQIFERNAIFLPAGNGKVAYATRDDMAEAAVTILTTAGHENKAYTIANNVSYSFRDVAAILSELSGKTIEHISPSPDVFTTTLKKAGVPEEAIETTLSFSQAIARGEFDFSGNTLEKLLGREPTSVKEFLQSVYSDVLSP